MKISKVYFVLIFLFASGSSMAQVQLSLKQLGDSLLEKNYSLRLVRIQEEISGVENTLGAAGYYPAIGLTGSQQYSVVNTRQQFFNGDIREANGAQNQALNLGVRLDWTLFNGFYVQSTKTELGLREDLARLNTILEIETELYAAASLYYEIVAREQWLASLDTALKYSRLRMDLVTKQLSLGKVNRLDYLQRSLELNADSAAWMQEKTALINLYTQLKQSMGMDPSVNLSLVDSLFALAPLAYETLLSDGLAQNNELRALKVSEKSAINQITKMKSQRYPNLALFSEYSFVSSQSALGILKSNRSLGPSVGLGLTYTIFNGSQVSQSISVARLQQKQARLNLDKASYDLEMNLLQIYEQYLLQKTLVNFEFQNVSLARENLRLARVQLNLGSINAFQFRDVRQLSIEAEGRYAQALFSLKQSELKLMLLSGGLLRYFSKTT